jgi:hypothetical protein
MSEIQSGGLVKMHADRSLEPALRASLLQATISFSALRSQPLRAAQLKATELKRQPSAQRQRGH